MRKRKGGKKAMGVRELDSICDCGELAISNSVFCQKCYDYNTEKNKELMGVKDLRWLNSNRR